MPISAIYEELAHIARTEFGDIVIEAKIMRLSTGDPLKLRLNLIDESLIDVHISSSGRYSYHWERRLIGREEIYRHDNAPHRAWDHVSTFPRHFHDGHEKNITESHISQKPNEALREFCTFVRRKLRDEASI